MGSKGSNTTTSSSSPNPQAMQLYQNLLTQAQGVAATPYNPYGGQLVAPVNQQQSTGIAGINQYSNAAQPAIQTAEGMAQQAASPITQAQIQGYMSPYTQDVVNATEGQFANQNAQQMQGVKGNAIAQGALGGNREAVAEAETANQQNLAQAPVIANLENQGYQTGLSTALSQQGAEAAGAYSLGNLGVAGQSAGLTGANAQVGAGSLQQQTQQADLSAQYQQFLNQQAYPFQTTQWLAGLGTGVGSQMGGTSSTTSPAPSLLGQIFGGVSSGAGILGASGAFGASGWLARGGGVSDRAQGGGISNHETTVPETPQTLIAQQQQLLQGHRRAQLFPHGTPELPVPHGVARATTEAGAIHYNPHHINAETVHHLASGGRLNELLDLGPVTKDEAMRRIHEGEHPVAVVERNEHGHEVRAALGTHLTAMDQLHAMHRTKSPGHTITLEHPDHVVARRIQHHMGGGVANRDTGGGVNYQTFGGGFGTPVVPYSGGKSWVPNMGITHGAGAPRPPSATGQQQGDLTSQMKNIGSLAGAIHTGMNTPSTTPVNMGGGQGIADNPTASDYNSTPIDTSGIDGAKRGGGISNYADGGTPNFDDRFSGVDSGALPPTIDGVPTQLLLGKGGFDAPAATPSFNDRFNGEPAPASGVAPPKGNGIPVEHITPSSGFTDDASTPPAAPAPEGVASTPAPAAPSPEGAADTTPLPHERPVTGIDATPDRTITRATPTGGYAGNVDRIAAAHRQIESADRQNPGGNYQAIGPLITHKHPDGTVTTDHAYGAYQVTGQNIPAWTKEVLGQSLTPTQFLGSKEAQDAVYKAKMGQYINQVGLDGAVHKWLGPGPKDNTTGVSQGEYLNRFKTALGMPASQSTGVASGDSGELPDKAGLVQSTPANQGVANQGPNIDWGANSKLWPALMAAGFGMMASRSPFPGVAIGEGGQQGTQTYGELRQQEQAQRMSQAKMDFEVKRLAQGADISANTLAQADKHAMLPYGNMTAEQKVKLGMDQAKLAEETRQHDLALRTPVKYGETRSGIPLMALPRPGPNGVDFYPIDPKTGTVAASPLGASLTNTPGPSGPNAPAPAPGGGAPAPGGGATTPAGFTPVAGGDAAERALDAAPPPQVRAAMPAGSPQARNDDYLTEVAKDDPRYAADIKAIANYQMSPSQFSVRNNRRERAMGDVMLYDPTYDQRRYNSTNQAITAFAKGKQGDAVRSFSVAIEHLGTAEELGKALQNGDIQLLNRVRNTFKAQFGYDAPANFDTAKQIVSDEIAKAVIGGQNAEQDRRGLQENLKNSSSPTQLAGVIHTFKELMGGQIIGYKHQYETSTGLHNFEDMLTPRARLEVSKVSADRDAKLAGQRLPAAGAPATPGAAAPTAPALPPGVPPGSVSGMKGGVPVWRTPDGQFMPKTQ